LTNSIDRRDFIKAGAAAMGATAALATGPSSAQAPRQAADMIFRGGTIVTMVERGPQVRAMAVKDGKILAVGTEAEVMALADARTEIIDISGRTLLPSFIDAHGHFMNSPQVVTWANVSPVPVGPVKGIPDIIAALKAHVAKFRIKPGDWILGYGYDGSALAEGRNLSRDDLDPVFPDNPVMLMHVSNHGVVMNSKAFVWAQIDENTETPPSGIILRKKGSKVPEGLVMETAFAPIFARWPKPSEQELLDTLDDAQQIYASVGVTTCQEGATHVGDLRFLKTAAAKGLFYLDVVALPLILDVPQFVKEYFPSWGGGAMTIPDTAAEQFGTYSNRLKLGGIKIPADGSPQGKTAFWSKPLLTPGPGGETNWRGQPNLPPEILNKAVAEIVGKNVPLFVHCNGDATIDMMIDAARLAGVKAEQDRRIVIIHSQFMRPDQIDAYAELGLTPSFFTAHCYFWGDVHVENTGLERASFISPMGAAKAKGIRFSNHNDFSVTPMDPMRMIWSAIKRETRTGTTLGPDQRVDAWTALKAITIDAAWQIREETSKGTIEVGKLADLVILDGNPLTAETDRILDIKAVQTFKEGRSVYRRAA
jgi:predicted amidohydrolase YtcJ